MLQAEALIHPRPPRDQMIIKRGGFLHPALGQGFVGKGHDKAAFIILGRFDRAPVRRRPIAETGNVHRPDINRRLTIYHPFGHRQPDAAALTKSRHHTHGAPIVLHARHRADHRVAVGTKGEGAVYGLPYPGLGQHRDTLKRKFQPVGDLVEIGLQQFMAEILRRAADLPGRALFFIGAQQQPVAFLAEIDICLIVNAAGQAMVGLRDRIYPFGQQIMMLHRLHWQIKPRHMADLARPKAAAIDHMFGVDRAP